MPLYRDLRRGYEMIYQPINGHLLPTHRLADEWNLRNASMPDEPGTHRHHVDFDRRNNRPTNLERMAAADHIRLHNAESYGEDFDPQSHGRAISVALARLRRDPHWRERTSRECSPSVRTASGSDERFAAVAPAADCRTTQSRRRDA